MTNAPSLTDRDALRRNRARASEFFLHREAMAEVEDRLAMVKRTFTAPAVVTPFPQVWSGLLPGARVVPDEETLDLVPGAHDLVVHAMGLHWADDPLGQIIQARRALKPDGLFLGVMLGGQTLHELRAALGTAESRVSGGLSPRIAPMGEIRDLGALIGRAGLALPVADTQRIDTTYRTAFHLMRDLRAMGEGNALAARLKRPTSRSVFTEAAQLYAEAHPGDEGRICATFELIFLTGWAPDASQPQPLRPGSATTRLSEVLGVPETPLDD